MKAFDLTSLPAERNTLAIFVQPAPGVELTIALIEDAFSQNYNSDQHGEAINGSGWACNISFAGVGVGAFKSTIVSDRRQPVCRALWTRTHNDAPPPEYLTVYDPCQTAIEDAGSLGSDVVRVTLDGYVQSSAAIKGRTTASGVWIYNPFPIVAPTCCNFAP
ncbi:MAG: hypothetical protein AABY13_05625 [Nanoarchaeota archaeon]